MDNPSDEAIAGDKALAEAWNEWRTMIDATECFNKPMEIAFAAGWRAAHARTIDQLRVAVEAWSKVLPIRVQDGPDYAEVYFSNGTAHCTQAMTMNPQDWRDLAEALTQIRSGQ